MVRAAKVRRRNKRAAERQAAAEAEIERLNAEEANLEHEEAEQANSEHEAEEAFHDQEVAEQANIVDEQANRAETPENEFESATADGQATFAMNVNDEVCPDFEYEENDGKKAFRCLQCKLFYLPGTHMFGNEILDYAICGKHLGVI